MSVDIKKVTQSLKLHLKLSGGYAYSYAVKYDGKEIGERLAKREGKKRTDVLIIGDTEIDMMIIDKSSIQKTIEKAVEEVIKNEHR